MERGKKAITFPKFIPVEQKTLSQILAWKDEKEAIENCEMKQKNMSQNL